MKTFEVTIEETLDQTFYIEASTMEEAMKIATQKYKDGEIILEEGQVTDSMIQVYDPSTEECTSWVEI